MVLLPQFFFDSLGFVINFYHSIFWSKKYLLVLVLPLLSAAPGGAAAVQEVEQGLEEAWALFLLLFHISEDRAWGSEVADTLISYCSIGGPQPVSCFFLWDIKFYAVLTLDLLLAWTLINFAGLALGIAASWGLHVLVILVPAINVLFVFHLLTDGSLRDLSLNGFLLFLHDWSGDSQCLDFELVLLLLRLRILSEKWCLRVFHYLSCPWISLGWVERLYLPRHLIRKFIFRSLG